MLIFRVPFLQFLHNIHLWAQHRLGLCFCWVCVEKKVGISLKIALKFNKKFSANWLFTFAMQPLSAHLAFMEIETHHLCKLLSGNLIFNFIQFSVFSTADDSVNQHKYVCLMRITSMRKCHAYLSAGLLMMFCYYRINLQFWSVEVH